MSAGNSWTGYGNNGRWYIGNFDGKDGDDIFRYEPGKCGARVFLSQKSGFSDEGCWTGAGSGSQGWYVADLNDDGKDDIFRYVPGQSGADVFLSTGSSFSW